MKYIFLQRDSRGELTGGFRTAECSELPVLSGYGETVLALPYKVTPQAILQSLCDGVPPPMFRVHGVYRVTVRLPDTHVVYDFDDLVSLRETLRDLAERYADQVTFYYQPLADFTASRLKAGHVIPFVRFKAGDRIAVHYVPETYDERVNLAGTEEYETLSWVIRWDVGELERNFARFGVTPEEAQEMREWVHFVAEQAAPDKLADMQRIAQTNGSWYRFKVGDFRIVLEFAWKQKILIWRMLLRRNRETYDDVEHRRAEVYPQARRRT